MRRDAWLIIRTVLCLFAGGFIFALAQEGCGLGAAERAANAVDTAAYAERLRHCLEVGRDAGSRAIYEECAEEADRVFGVDAGITQTISEGGRR